MSSTDGITRPATSADVARLAGVSRTTVSSVLNGNAERFPEDTRQRVREAAARLNYRPSPAARSLVSGHSDMVVVLVPANGFGPNLQGAVEAAAERAKPLGASVVIRIAGPTPGATVDGIQALRPLAVLNFGGLAFREVATLEGAGIIVVPQLNSVSPSGSDSALGIEHLQADALLSNGPRPLWFADLHARQDPFDLNRGAELGRYCRELKLPAPREIGVPLNLPGAVAALETILQIDPQVGVACYNDDVALALLAASRQLGVSVPDQLAVVGMDYSVAGQLWSPRLTSIKVDTEELVRTLTDEMVARIAGNDQGWNTSGPLYQLMPGGTV